MPGREIYTQGISCSSWTRKLGILEPGADPYFQNLLALNYAFLVGTQLHAPGALKKASTQESIDEFKKHLPRVMPKTLPSLCVLLP